ncbi:MAG: DUF2231 domain-containing protein [Gammaproteobacteria bacterium]|nr:DUF2231 domain-containing protein [Gammaproteobacteria bacterium]
MPEIIPNFHPIFVHFTVALLSLSVALHVVMFFVKSPLKEQWKTVANWSLWFGAGVTVITALTGLDAYNTVAHDTPSHLAMTEHRNWAVVTVTLFLTLAAWSIIWARKESARGVAFAACMVIAGGVLGATAWHGGELVYRYGLGVMSLPQSEGDGHSHAHGEGGGHAHGDDKGQVTDHDDMMDFSGMDEMSDDGHDHKH